MRVCPRTEPDVLEDRVSNTAMEQELWTEDAAKGSLSEVLALSSGQEWKESLAKQGEDPREKILALYDEYRPKLYRYMRSMHLEYDRAEEVIQETFMRLTNELLKEKESNIENLQGWIVRVAHNLAVNLFKRERSKLIDSESAALLIENRVDPALSPEEVYAQKEQKMRLKLVLSTLRPLHRQCFQLRAQGFRYKDIGQALGISEQRAAFIVKQVAVRLAAICG